MNPVATIILPHNDRLTFDPEASEEMLGAFATLPIRMPKTSQAWTDPDSGKPVAMWCDGVRIRPADFAVIWAGVQEYNVDLQRQGVVPESPMMEMMGTVLQRSDG